MACGISAACRGPDTERQKFCFKVFDRDRDGKLNHEELQLMVQTLLQMKDEEIDDGEGMLFTFRSCKQMQCLIKLVSLYKAGMLSRESGVFWR